MVKFGMELVPVADEVVELIQKREAEIQQVFDSNVSQFKKGDRLEITEGPLAGLQAVFQMQNAQERIFVLMEILGKQSRVSLSMNQVVKA